jgi:hypothetical protein
MNLGNFDPTSIILLLLGKDNSWIPLIAVITIVLQKWDSIMGLYYRGRIFGKTQYKVTGTFYNNIDDSYTYGALGSSMWALIRFINNLVKSDAKLLSTATNIRLPHNDVFDTNDVVVIPSSKTILKLTKDIDCDIEMSYYSRETSRGDKQCAIDSTTITFTLTTKGSFDIIMKFMSSIIEKHTKDIESKHKESCYIIKPRYSRETDDPETTELSYPQTIKLESSKSFDNLFFDGKEELINRLNSFVKRDKYKTLGLPETLGLLFHGDPGTGKTSCIKAIAKYLDMSIIIVPMNHIKTKKRLEELFFSSRINTPQDKRIYVFEEVDCNGWENIVRDRTLIKPEDEETVTSSCEKESDTFVVKKKTEKNNDKLTLGGILEIIDGIIECPGRVIIMTTNHKEHLDSALLRPGRIDMTVEFKKLRHTHIAEIYKKWYGDDLKEYHMENIDDYKYTQAEISQLLFKHENDSKGFIREIIK